MEGSRSVLLGSGKVESRLGKKFWLSSESSTEKPTIGCESCVKRKRSVCVHMHVLADQGLCLEPSTRHRRSRLGISCWCTACQSRATDLGSRVLKRTESVRQKRNVVTRVGIGLSAE